MSASSIKTIKNRINSISGTMQITKAMELVAASKMRKAMEYTEKAKPFFNMLYETVADVANADVSSVFTHKRDGRECHIIIAGDRGLAGGYNNNIFRSVTVPEYALVLPIGKKAAEHYSKCNIFTAKYSSVSDITKSDCFAIGEMLANAYKNGEFTELTLTYTAFVNTLVQKTETKKILPLASIKKNKSVTLYEPDAQEVLGKIVPYYVSGMIYGAVSEAAVSELSARKNAMQSATDNATQMIDRLKLEYNRARQASITQELTEIISGSENLKQRI